MKKICVLILAALLLCAGFAQAETQGILGQPFPDFTVTDTEGKTFTLSEALRDHDAVLINLWATWCGYCEKELPDLENVYQAYGDRVAFIALSGYKDDSMSDIAAYRESHGVSFPMSSDIGAGVAAYSQAGGYPTTIVVDRFGNAIFKQEGAFAGASQIRRVLDAVLTADYPESRVLTGIPNATATAAYPVAAQRRLIVENENARRIRMTLSGQEAPFDVYAVNDDTARLRIELTPTDDPDNTVLYVFSSGTLKLLSDLLDENARAYRYALALPGEADGYHYDGAVLVKYSDDDEDNRIVYLISSEAYIEEFMDEARGEGLDVAWSFAEDEGESAAPRYTVYVVDQNGDPVPGAFLNICTDSMCMPTQSDENGVIAFDGAPDVYHLQLIAVPDGYSFDADFDMYTAPEYGEWALRVHKD